jgi:hypothetical protein
LVLGSFRQFFKGFAKDAIRMAGDWIKWEKGLERKREVLMISAALERTPFEVATRLMMLWAWCDDNILDEQIDKENGDAHVTLGASQMCAVDALAGVPGFADAMTAAGWLCQRNSSLTFPNYGRHNGSTAKTRAQNAKRNKKLRDAKTVTNVTLPASPRGKRKSKSDTASAAKPRKAQPTDPYFDALAAEYYPTGVPKGQASSIAKRAKELLEMKADPAEIPVRRRILAKAWGGNLAKVTMHAAVENWGIAVEDAVDSDLVPCGPVAGGDSRLGGDW